MNAEMPLPTDEDRALLRESLRGWLAEHWPADAAGRDAGDAGRLRAVWRELAQQGLASLGSDADLSSGGLQEMLLVAEELGRAACPAPVIAATVLNLAGWPADAPPPALAAMREGEAFVTLAFAQAEGDAGAGRVDLHEDGTLSGHVAFVEAGAAATHLAVVAPGARLAIVDLGAGPADRAKREDLVLMGQEPSTTWHFDHAPVAAVFKLGDEALARLQAASRLGHVARAIGAATRAFELAVAYAGERRQFGVAIGSFQAVQHKLADVHIALLGASLTARHAAQQHDRGSPQWAVFADAAAVLAGEQLRQAALQIQHAFGAIGYSEEHEAPRHFRRVHLDLLRHGGARRAREALAAWYLDGPPRTLPESDLGAAGNAFRAEVRDWLARHWHGERQAAHRRLSFKQREYDREFARELGKTGWIGLAWPQRFGGQGRSAFEQLAFIEAMERADAPRAGAPVQAAMLMVHGTPAQQQRLLPEILRGEAIYGMGYSEPDAGSDLAALRTRAERVSDERGDGWLINGQKIWTTTYWGEYMLLAARTNAAARPKHAGISMFIVPMDTPGITVRTSETMYGGSFANVFYDDVRLPPDALVGEVDGGWQVLTGALATERGFIGGGIVMKVARSFELLCEHVRQADADGRPLAQDPFVRERIASLAAQIEAGRQMMLHCAARVVDGETPPADAAASKVYSGELMERFGEVALDILGLSATVSEGSPGALLRGRIEQQLRHSLMWVISIGTNEIQRSLIAQRGLGLPR
jgi:alkylation response protein AidB-like acyl-CoA dehydrogenase